MIYLSIYVSIGLLFAIAAVIQGRIFVQTTGKLNAVDDARVYALSFAIGIAVVVLAWPWVPIQMIVWPKSFYWVCIRLV